MAGRRHRKIKTMPFPDVGEFARKLRVSDADLRTAMRMLIERQFLYRGDYGTARYYDILANAGAGPTFSELFDWMGYRFHNRDDQNWIGLLPDEESGSGARISIDHTILILMLGFIFNQSREIGRYGTVMTTYMDISNAYSENLRGTPTPQRTKLWQMLTDLKRRGIIDLDVNASALENAEIEIRPMISTLLPADLADRIQAHAVKRRTRKNNEAALKAAAHQNAVAEPDTVIAADGEEMSDHV
jgi:hypothetical protein